MGACPNDVVHHEEVVGEALGLDDSELALESFARDRCDGAIPPLGALIGEPAESLDRALIIGKARRHDPADRNAILTSLGDLGSGTDRLGAIGKGARDVGGRTDPRIARGEVDTGLVGGGPLLEGRQRGVEMNGAKKPVARPVFRMRHDRAGGDRRGQVEPPGFGEYGVTILPGSELSVEVAGAAALEQAFQEGGVGREEDESVAVVRQLVLNTSSPSSPPFPSFQ